MNRQQLERTLGGPVVWGHRRWVTRSGWRWRISDRYLRCDVCARIFPNGAYRRVNDVNECPYLGCPGQLPRDAREWRSVRLQHPEYPQVPWMGIQYPFDDSAPMMPTREGMDTKNA